MSTCSTVCELRFVSASGTSWLLEELGDVHGDDDDEVVVEAVAIDADSNNVSPSRCLMASTIVSRFCLDVLVRYTLRTNATQTKMANVSYMNDSSDEQNFAHLRNLVWLLLAFYNYCSLLLTDPTFFQGWSRSRLNYFEAVS